MASPRLPVGAPPQSSLVRRRASSRSEDAAPAWALQHPAMAEAPIAEHDGWQPELPRIQPVRFVLAWLILTASVGLAAWIAPGVKLDRPASALAVAAVIAILNALLPPIIAALPLPYMLPLGFFGILFLDAALLLLADRILPNQVHVA